MIRFPVILSLLFVLAACESTEPTEGTDGASPATGEPAATADASAAGVARQCAFDPSALAFAGTPDAQARCLLAPVRMYAHLGPPLRALPRTLGARVGQAANVSRAGFRAYLAAAGLTEASVGGDLDAPVSSTRDGHRALYFVIHDTSSPYFGNDPFPPDLNTNAGVNNLRTYQSSQAAAHVFVNRMGQVYLGHDFAVPWRATKRESQLPGGQLRGRFLHVELIQPRRRDPAGGARNDAIAPEPGFTAAQYRRLAEAYVAASLRAGTWLIPAYHAVLDNGLPDGHDDPQNFDLPTWDAQLAAVLSQLEG